jgi:hypothetical protein
VTTTDQPTPAEHDDETWELIAEVARLTGKAVADIATMSVDEMMDHTARTSFHTLGLELAIKYEKADGVHLMEDGPSEQAERVAAALTKYHERRPLFPVRTQGSTYNLYGFGEAPIHFVHYDEDGKADEQYLVLSELAEALAVPLHQAHEWARRDWADAIQSQREIDEERGQLGWECLEDLVDLGLYLTVADDQANPDADGKRWSCAGDWLVSDDRLLSFMTISPWCEEFMHNAKPLFAHAFVKSGLAETLGNVQTYRQPPWNVPMEATDFTLGDRIRRDAEETPEDEAAKRAMRGPVGPLEG